MFVAVHMKINKTVRDEEICFCEEALHLLET